MTDTSQALADEMSENVGAVMGILNKTMEGHDIGAVLMGCAGFIRMIIDHQIDGVDRASAWGLVLEELCPEDEA